MKPLAFLLVPMVATLLNLLVALWTIQHAAGDLIPTRQESASVELCRLVGETTLDCDDSILATADFANPDGLPSLTLKEDAYLKNQHAAGDLIPTQQESASVAQLVCENTLDCDDSIPVAADFADPDGLPSAALKENAYLKKMPDFDFMAYVRRDVAAFYQEEERSMNETEPEFEGQAGKFVNMSPERLGLYWDPGRGKAGSYIVAIGPFESGGTATYPGHVFYFAPHGKPSQPVCYFHVVKGTSVYYYDPFSKGGSDDTARCVTADAPQSLESLNDDQKSQYEAHVVNMKFGEAYKEFTGGSEWLAMYPKSPPSHHIWGTDYFGQEHTVKTRETHFKQLPPSQELKALTSESMRRNDPMAIPFKEYRTNETFMNVTLKVVSCEPRIFEIPHLISDIEAEHLLDLSMGKGLHRSTTGDLRRGSKHSDVSSTRTSTNAWISRYSSPIVDAIYRRVADVLLIDEALLRFRMPDEKPETPTKQPLSEDLQLVHYDVGEEYTTHHDFGYPDTRHPESPSRSINILLYLNDDDLEGGETSFPRWRNAHTDGGIDVKPEKGKAALFYMVGPDGNRDDLTQHAALPVIKGEKYMANLWIWDPIKP